MLNLFGQIGAHYAVPNADAVAKLEQLAGWPAEHGPRESTAALGARWGCIGPSVASEPDLALAVRGRPIWRGQSSPCDAYSLLEAYKTRGRSFLELLDGAFALALIDAARRTAILAVDRMGVERLAYAHDGKGVTFGSSAERVARALSGAPRLDRQAVLSYLFFHMVPSPETIFEGVRKIPPATAVVFEDNARSEIRYWQPVFIETNGGNAKSLSAELHTALATGVRAANPDGTTGAFLSGGLDSSTVAGYLGKVTERPPRTFSIGFGFDDYDELQFARIAVKQFHCDPREYTVRPEDIVQLFPVIARAYDEPFGNASALPTYCCARLARENGITHLLAGDGGDEIFAGNKRYAEQLIFERYQLVPRLLRAALLEPALRAVPGPLAVGVLRKGRNYVAQAKTRLPDRLENWNFLNRLGFSAILDPEFERSVDIGGPLTHMRSVYDAAPSGSAVNRMLYYDWRFTLADNDLRKVGAMCELAGVQVSYPMLHADVVEMSNRVPPALKMRGTELRSFYKDAMTDFLPREIIHKTKHGFGLPFGLWLERSPELAALIEANLASLSKRKLIRAEFVNRLRRLHGTDDARYYGVLVWTLAMLEQWLQEHSLSV